MATTHEVLTKLITQNVKVQDDTQKALRYMLQRSAPNISVLSASATGVATTVLTAIPGLSITNGVGYNSGNAVVGGRTYQFLANLYVTVDATAGIKIDFQGGTATFSSYTACGEASTAAATTTALAVAAATPVVASSAAYVLVIAEGTFVASASGSFNIRVACNVAGVAPIILTGSNLQLTEIAQ